MDVKLSTIVSRFSFPFSSFDAVDEDDSLAGHALARREETEGARQRPPQSSSASHTHIDEGMDGSHAYVQGAGSAASSLANAEAIPNKTRKLTSRRDEVVDLVRLASCMWNTELQRSATTAAPTVCVLRPPPFVFDNVVYRAASVYVMPSGVVRLVTYGSVFATWRIAQRVRSELREAYLPEVVRCAANEERRLLNAVFGVDDGEQHAAAKRIRAANSINEREIGTSLPALLASNSLETMKPLKPGGEEDASRSICSVDKTLKIDFIQSVATPRWGDIAGLREALFLTQSSADAPDSDLEASNHGEAGHTLSLLSSDAHQLPENTAGRNERTAGQKESSFSARLVAPVAVARASVNVRGDAPLAWWRWFLAANGQDTNNESLENLFSAVEPQSRNTRGRAGGATEGGELALAASDASDNVYRLWFCAGHNNVSPNSSKASGFIQYLQLKRARVAHHVVSFKVRRNASQNSIQLLLEWNLADAPPRSGPVGQLFSPRVPQYPPRASLQLPIESPTEHLHTVNTLHQLASVSRIRQSYEKTSVFLGDTSASLSSKTTFSRTQNSGNAWVTEASTANFFLESTFIAESTVPYGLESTRPGTGLEESALTLPVREVLATSSSAVVSKEENRKKLWAAGAQSFDGSTHNVNEPSVKLSQDAATQEEPSGQSQPSHGGMFKRQRQAEVEKPGPVVTEQVSCIIHRTGRVQLSTGSEVAIRQVCDVLLIPFLVATADLTLLPKSAEGV